MKYFSYLCTYKERFATLLSETMDSTHISGKQLLFAYCITDGLFDEMCPEQRASIISIIESLLSEGEDANSERLLSGGDVSASSKKKKNNYFFLFVRPNNSLLDMTARKDRFK